VFLAGNIHFRLRGRDVTDTPTPNRASKPSEGGLPVAESSPAAVPSGLDRRFEIAVDGLIGAYDLSANAAVQTHIAQVLARVGVERVVVQSGVPFDPSLCEAVSTVVTEDPARFQHVVEMVRPGWRQTDAVLRSPQVSVWVAAPADSDSAGARVNGGD
jgi:GrpE